MFGEITMNIPNDADGDAMRRVIAGGADVTRPMRVNFHIDCPDLPSAQAVAAKVPREEFDTSVYSNSQGAGATCECSRSMLLEHSELARIQAQLSKIAGAFGGLCEAWGTFGNAQGTAQQHGADGGQPVCPDYIRRPGAAGPTAHADRWAASDVS